MENQNYGIDIAAKQGTKIKSSCSGVVTMAEDDLYYTGGNNGHGSRLDISQYILI